MSAILAGSSICVIFRELELRCRNGNWKFGFNYFFLEVVNLVLEVFFFLFYTTQSTFYKINQSTVTPVPIFSLSTMMLQSQQHLPLTK